MRAFALRLLLLVLGLAVAGVLAVVAWRAVLDHYAGGGRHAPEDAPWVLTAPAEQMIDAAFAEAGARIVVDHRVNVLARGQLGAADQTSTGGYRADNGARRTPLSWLTSRMREHAAGIRDRENADAEYLSRLMRQIQAMPSAYRVHMLARDAVYDRDGQRNEQQSRDYVADRYVAWIRDRAGKTVVPVASVHPYRLDAAAVLERRAKAGVTNVSWLPVVQRIDLDDPRARDCYRVMAAHDMTLQLPVGYRQAGNGTQGWIDPAALQVALDAGVNVVVTVAGARSGDGREVMPGLFRLLREARYRKRLAIDLAGMLATAQHKDVLLPVLQHPQFYGRLRYASGYPESAIARAIDLATLARRGFIDADTVKPLRAIYDINPLLFVFVVMRQVHLPSTDMHLPGSVFFTEAS